MNLILKNFLTDEVSPYMKEIGYRKSGGYFYRQNEHFVYTICIGDYDIHVLGDHVRKSLLNLNEFFKSIKDIDDFLSLLLENGCGRQPFFSNYVVKYSLS